MEDDQCFDTEYAELRRQDAANDQQIAAMIAENQAEHDSAGQLRVPSNSPQIKGLLRGSRDKNSRSQLDLDDLNDDI
jgi:hypothetical protein